MLWDDFLYKTLLKLCLWCYLLPLCSSNIYLCYLYEYLEKFPTFWSLMSHDMNRHRSSMIAKILLNKLRRDVSIENSSIAHENFKKNFFGWIQSLVEREKKLHCIAFEKHFNNCQWNCSSNSDLSFYERWNFVEVEKCQFLIMYLLEIYGTFHSDGFVLFKGNKYWEGDAFIYSDKKLVKLWVPIFIFLTSNFPCSLQKILNKPNARDYKS